MDQKEYEKMLLEQEYHWWFKAKRDIIKSSIKTFSPNLENILEIGSGTGSNIKMLQEFAKLTIIEPNLYARSKIKENFKDSVEILDGKLPNNLNLNKKFDLICLFDVLEHIKEDLESLKILKQYLNQDGKIIITVPAFQFLFSQHDVNLHHFRRYNQKQLKKLIKQSDYEIEFISYFNFFLFPLALISRIWLKIFSNSNPKNDSTSETINYLLYKIFSFEKYFLKQKLKFPFGLSAIVIIKNR